MSGGAGAQPALIHYIIIPLAGGFVNEFNVTLGSIAKIYY